MAYPKNDLITSYVQFVLCIAGTGPTTERQSAVPRLLPVPQQRQGLGAQCDREAGVPDSGV